VIAGADFSPRAHCLADVLVVIPVEGEDSMNLKSKFVLPISLLGSFWMVSPAAARADSLLYTNGAPEYLDDVDLSSPSLISDSFTVSSDSELTSVTAALWIYSGDSLGTLGWDIGTTKGGDQIAGGSTGSVALTSKGNGFGYNFYEASFDIIGTVDAGTTYYLTLDDSGTSGVEVEWDIDNGSSQAYQDYHGETPGLISLSGADGSGTGSESFQIFGTPVPEPCSVLLLGSGLLGLGTKFRRKRLNSRP
jgi:hypothetical protein